MTTIIEERPTTPALEPDDDVCHIGCCVFDNRGRCGEDLTGHPVVTSWSGKWCADCVTARDEGMCAPVIGPCVRPR